jgi:ubiquinone/menaquinone biosynthesis C-methylase UbiE
MSVQAQAKPFKGIGMEGFIARHYASLTGKARDEFRDLARRESRKTPEGSRVLEVAPGPGYFAVEMAKLGYKVAGLDISRTMVEIARGNAAEAGVRVNFRQGDAAHMPFDANSFDFILCRAAFKNFTDPVGALEEMYRVLAPGGRAVIIDLRREAPYRSIRNAVKGMKLNPLAAFTTKMTFRFMLLRRAYTRSEFEGFVEQTWFKQAEIAEDGLGFEATLKKP